DAYVAAGGTIVEIDPAERAAWANAMPNIAVEWAANLDGNGEQGTEMLRTYMGKLADAGFTPVRDWTAELTN
ncbi:MAG: C4-dicarboxylate TRAP transporter substrate-binding protein, partial [Boseongicola sp.]